MARPSCAGAPDRIISAAALALRYPNARVVFSGGSANVISNDAREADFAGAIFESLGVAKSRLIMERASRNTVENAEFSKALVAPKAGERWLLVTSAFHMPRSIGLFRKAGFAVEPYPVDWRVGGRGDLLSFTNVATDGLGRTDLGGARMDGPDRLPGHRQDRRFAAGTGAEVEGRNRLSGRATIDANGARRRSGSLRHATANAAGSVRFGRHGGRSEQPAAAQDHRDRHQDVRNRRRDDGDSEDPAAQRRSHHRPDRQHGLAARLDRRHHRRRSRRRAMPRRDRPRADRTKNSSKEKTMSASGMAPPKTRACARKRSMWCRTANIRRWR